MSRFKKLGAGLGVLAVTALVLTACNGSSTGKAVLRDNQTSAHILNQYEQAQPVPEFKWSQYRQTLIDIETAQANGSQTTSFFFNLGDTTPIASCPSIGFPIASTSELTNPAQVTDTGNGSNGSYTGDGNVGIPQIDPNGVYTGDSTGTYVICVNGDGSSYAEYWEGFVDAVSGPAVWDASTNSVKLTGPSSTTFHVGKS